MDRNNIINNTVGGPQQPVGPVGPEPQSQPVPSQPQPVQSIQPVQPQPQPVPTVQPVQSQPQMPQGQALGGVPSQDYQTQKKPRNKALMITIIAIVVMAVIAGIVAVVILFMGGGSVSMESVKNYCEKNGLEIEEGNTESEPKMKYITCNTKATVDDAVNSYTAVENGNNNQKSDFIEIDFGIAEEPIMEYEDFTRTKNFMEEHGLILGESDNYVKAFMATTSGNVIYMIADGNTYVTLMASSDDLAKAVLTEIGYPDKDWPTEQDMQNLDSTEKLEQRNIQRRNDMSRVDTSLVQYQVNHANQSNNLPEAGSWAAPVSKTFPTNCASNTACSFVRDYLNAGSTGDGAKTNSFEDPDGVSYSLVITDNWSEPSNVKNYGLGESKLTTDADGNYTIQDNGGGAYDEHVIYIVPGGKCVDNAVTSSTKRHFAILYLLEGDAGAYCIDDQ